MIYRKGKHPSREKGSVLGCIRYGMIWLCDVVWSKGCQTENHPLLQLLCQLCDAWLPRDGFLLAGQLLHDSLDVHGGRILAKI